MAREKYAVLVPRRAQKQIAGIAEPARKRLVDKIASLANSPRPVGTEKLTGTDAYRIRVGDYRIVYGISDRMGTVVIACVSHRRDVYR